MIAILDLLPIRRAQRIHGGHFKSVVSDRVLPGSGATARMKGTGLARTRGEVSARLTFTPR
jgi:hypothetical protein